MIFYTYLYLRLDGSPYYVGKGSGNRVFSTAHRVSPPKHAASQYRQYDRSRVLIQCWHDEATAFAYERYLIDFWGRKNNGTGILRNLTDGGEGPTGHKHTPEARRKISAAGVGSKRPGRTAWNKGQKWSEETKRRQRLAKLGKKQSSETVEKRCVKLRGQKRSLDCRNLLSEVAKVRGLSSSFIAASISTRFGNRSVSL